ncbi:MAG: protein-export chaperone SecB [Oscillospiraceae bacterium]|nr:protein-export chaperone SecB [Oscillospiraceae bacterium]
MAVLKLQSCEITELEYKKNIRQSGKIDLETSVAYNLRFADREKICVGECRITIRDKEHEGKILLRVNHVGRFVHDIEEPTPELKRKFHIETAKVLYPFWNTALSNLITVTGLPPMVLRPLEIDEEDVVLFQLPKKE